MDAASRPFIGLAVFILNSEGKLLLGKRKGSHGAGMFAVPGGHLEFGESFEDAVHRETGEETGLIIDTVQLFHVDNNRRFIEDKGKHFVTLMFKTSYTGNLKPQVLEPEKCDYWDWYDLDDLPQPAFESDEVFARLKQSITTT